MKAIIPAAGLGTRFLPATKAQPKEMLPVLNKPAIQYVVEEALVAQVDEVILVSNREKQSIADHFAPNDTLVARLRAAGKTAYAEQVAHAGSLPVSFVEQSEALGLGHAIHCAASNVLHAQSVEPFFVLLGDVLVPSEALLPRMLQVSREHAGASVIAVVRVPHEQVSRFGIIAGESIGGDVWRVSAMVEKPALEEAPSDLAIFGRYLLTPRVMELLSQTEPGAGGEIQLTDALVDLLKTEEVYAVIIDEEEGFDVGTIETWLTTNIRLAARDPLLAKEIANITH